MGLASCSVIWLYVGMVKIVFTQCLPNTAILLYAEWVYYNNYNYYSQIRIRAFSRSKAVVHRIYYYIYI